MHANFKRRDFMRIFRRIFFGLIVAISMLVGGLTGTAQTSQGEIRGRVTDSNGAAVAGAAVEITNQATGEKRNTTSNDQGEYLIPSLIVGIYDVRATAAGFAQSTTQGVKVSVAFT